MVEYEVQIQLNRIEAKLDAIITEGYPQLIKEPEQQIPQQPQQQNQMRKAR